MRIFSSVALLKLCLTTGLPAAGELDTAFNPNVNGEIKALALAPDGKIVIGGSFTAVGGEDATRIARLLPDGRHDPNWVKGKTAGAVPSCVVLADGSTLVADPTASSGTSIYRLLPDGTWDNASPVRVSEGPLHGMALDAGGNLLLAGGFHMVNSTSCRGFGIVGMDGVLKSHPISEAGAGKSVFTLLHQADRGTLLGGDFTQLNGANRNHLVKIGLSGSLDVPFAPLLTVGSNTSVLCLANALTSTAGTFYAGGSFTQMWDGKVISTGLARFSSTGILDQAFKPIFSHPTKVPRITSIAVQSDGKIIVAGEFTAVNGVGSKGLARLNSSGATDRSFTASAEGVTGLALQMDGKIIITGDFLEVNGVPRSRIARLNNDSPGERLTLRQNFINWSPLGTTPQCNLVEFEVSTDGGAVWQPVGKAQSTVGRWQVSDIDLPLSGVLRIRGRTSSGLQNGSSGLVEKEVSYSFAPRVNVRERTATGTDALSNGQIWPLSYGELRQGSPATKTLEIYNSGSSRLTVAGIQLPPGFIWLNPPALPATIDPSSPLTVTLQADATTLGSLGGTVVVATDDAEASTFVFPLAAEVVGPDIAMHLGGVELPNDRAQPVSFAQGYQGTTPVRETFVISNQGNRDLAVGSISVGAGFAVDGPQAFVLHPGESQEIQVGPDQSIAGSLTGNLEVHSDDGDEPLFRVPLATRVWNPLAAKVMNARTTLDRKSGLRLQKLRITNTTKTATVAGFRVIVRGLPEWVQVRNASEILPDGSVVIEVHQPLGRSGKFNLVLEYEIPKGKPVVVVPIVTTEVILGSAKSTAAATALAVEKCELGCEGHFAVTFRSIPGRLYQVEYSADGKVWKASTPTRAAGSKVRWVDCGSPHTECAPKDAPARLYRVKELE